MNANKAIELGFADGMLMNDQRYTIDSAYAFSGKAVDAALVNKLRAKAEPAEKTTLTAKAEVPEGRCVDELMQRLNLLKY